MGKIQLLPVRLQDTINCHAHHNTFYGQFCLSTVEISLVFHSFGPRIILDSLSMLIEIIEISILTPSLKRLLIVFELNKQLFKWLLEKKCESFGLGLHLKLASLLNCL